MQAYQHVNRMGNVYLLQSKSGNSSHFKYSFTRKLTGTPVEHLPEGYEARENPDSAQVTLRRIRPSAIRDGERLLLEKTIRAQTDGMLFIVDVEAKSLVVYTSDMAADVRLMALRDIFPMESVTAKQMVSGMLVNARYSKMLRFTLIDAKKRLFSMDRWCFLGSIDNWFYIEGAASLPTLADKYVKHLGKESFFDLMRGRTENSD